MLDNQIIIVHEGKIKEVGTNLKTGKTDTHIGLFNIWVLPGLMDWHVHITTNFSYRSRNWNETYVTESNSLRAIRGKIDQDFPGFPNCSATEKWIKPKTAIEKKWPP